MNSMEHSGGEGNVVLAHPSGNQFFRHLACALRDKARLAELCTCIDWRGGGKRLLPRSLQRELERRSFSLDLRVPVARHPWREAARLAASRMGLTALTRHETGPISVDAVYRDFDRWVARRLGRVAGASIVYAYEDAAETMFDEAARLGWQCVYDLPIAHWKTSRQLLDEEAERYPNWEPTLVGTRDSAGKQARKDRELASADIVVCPSRFVAESLPDEVRSKKQVVVAPFGSPTAVAGATAAPKRGGPLRVLFAGSMSQRKGLADLFAAMRELKRRDVQLVVLGSPVADMTFYRREFPDFIHEASRPHADVLALMRTCDVLCLPSIVEGRALVVQEAMSQGLPVIITSHTGADDVVEEDSNGFVVPIRAPARIAAAIAWCADHREELEGFSSRARAAAARFTWERYGERILAVLGKGRCAVPA